MMLEAFGFSPTRAVQNLTRYLLAPSLALARAGVCSSDIYLLESPLKKSDFVADEYHGIDATHFLLARTSDATTMYGILCLASACHTNK